jgi:hypothetical protein
VFEGWFKFSRRHDVREDVWFVFEWGVKLLSLPKCELHLGSNKDPEELRDVFCSRLCANPPVDMLLSIFLVDKEPCVEGPRCVKRWLLERLIFEVAIVEEWFFVNSEFPWIFLLSPASPSDWYIGRSILCSWKYYVGCFKTFRQFSISNYLLRSLCWKFPIHINAHVSNILLQFIFYHSLKRLCNESCLPRYPTEQ